ncbi:MAG TPA: LLM class flavin-dependent oxidoreductase [Candidatus Acidoferrum sp.]|nr:LLM class flavin-dependent oxidoreductase [Candidatus Acidoferrum sp.]
MARYSILDLALVTEGSTPTDAYQRTLDLARHAEKWGYTRYWLAEHHNMPGVASSATAVLIAAVAGATSTIRVGSGGVMLPNHSSLIIAEQFGTLESLFPGRIDLGMGRAPGSDRLTAHAVRRGLGNSEDGFPLQVQELLTYLGPASPGQAVRAIPGEGTNVPIWLLGSSTYSAALAASLGLRFAFASHFAPEQLLDALEIYRTNFQPSQWLQAPYTMVGVAAVVADTDREAERLATTVYQRALQLIRGGALYSRPPVDRMDDLWSDPERMAVESRLAVAVIGSPETVTRRLAALLRETRADELMFTSDLYHHADRLRSFELLAGVMCCNLEDYTHQHG